MKSKSGFLLPKKASEIPNGGVYRESVRCGKAKCKCGTAGEQHAAFYFMFRVNGKQRKKYVRKEDIQAMKALVENARRDRKEFRAVRKEGILTYRALRSLLASLGNQ